MRFLVDMGLGIGVSAWLRTQGHDAIHLREENLHKMPDRDIFAKAVNENRIVLTCDLGFSEIASMARRNLTSVIVFRTKNTRVAYVISRLEPVLAQASVALVAGAIVTVEEVRHRVRRLPIGE